MSKPKIIEIGEILELHRGYDLPISQRIEGNIPVYGSSGITGWHDNYKCDGELIITGRCGTIGKVFYHKGKCWPLNTSLYLSDSKGNDVRYLGYLLQYSFDELIRVKGQDNSAVPGIDRKVIHSLKTVFWDSLNYQKKVSNFLSNIDRLIEKNTQMIATLESMAKTLYDYWFVQFDFPDANGRPYKTSGGKMVWNEELGREIPDEWGVKTIGEICETRLGGTPDTNNNDYWGGEIPWLNSGEVAVSPILESEKTITELGRDNSATSTAAPGDVLMSITRYIRPSILGITACYNQSVVAIIQNSSYKTSFIYPFLLSQVDRYMGLRIGAQQPHINKKIVDSTPVINPTKEILEAYYLKIDKTYQQIINIAKETKTLISLRDFLLPMLMNGQVTFK